MDESKLSELLRDAVADTPPPTFDRLDIMAESGRQRQRRRNAILTGSSLGVALLAGMTALTVALWTGANSAEQTNAADSAAASGNGNAAPYELPNKGDAEAAPTERGGGDQNSSPESRKQGRTSDEEAGPAGPGSTSSGCEQADRELAAALAGELPAAANVRTEDALPVQFECPVNSTGVTFRLADGTISALVVPPDAVMADSAQLVGWQTEQGEATAPDGDRILVISAAPTSGEPPPYAGQLVEWAEQVALKY